MSEHPQAAVIEEARRVIQQSRRRAAARECESGDNSESNLLWRCAAALESTMSTSDWRPRETAPDDGTPFRAYGPALVHPDFNPWGSVEAVYDGERFVGAVWDGVFDAWNTVEIEFTHWQPIPAPPSSQQPLLSGAAVIEAQWRAYVQHTVECPKRWWSYFEAKTAHEAIHDEPKMSACDEPVCIAWHAAYAASGPVDAVVACTCGLDDLLNGVPAPPRDTLRSGEGEQQSGDANG